MNLDVNTLFLVTDLRRGDPRIAAAVRLGAEYRDHAVAWWGFAHLLRAGSIMLFGLYGPVPDLITIDLANVVAVTAFALTWTGARVFDHRSPQPI